tara:strand:- start:2738 stop:2935 length:198 start_codon:yes stop_codon:yes gene_type:complete
MNITQILENLDALAKRQYENYPAEDRLAYHVGLLQSKIREFNMLIEGYKEQIKELEMELIIKDSK